MYLLSFDDFITLTDEDKYSLLENYYTQTRVQKDFINRLVEKQKLVQKELDCIIFDMDTIDGKPATQEELCKIFNILNED